MSTIKYYFYSKIQETNLKKIGKGYYKEKYVIYNGTKKKYTECTTSSKSSMPDGILVAKGEVLLTTTN